MEISKNSCEIFLEALASASPVPGGGGAAAFGGALGIALGSMVGSLTLGKKKYIHVQSDVERMLSDMEQCRYRMLRFVQEDAEVFLPLSKAYGMPNKTAWEKQEKAKVMEEALQKACDVPLRILKECMTAIVLLQEMGEKGTKMAVSDIAVGAVFIRATAQAAVMNVLINTKMMKNKEYAEQYNTLAKQLCEEVVRKADTIYDAIEGGLK